MTTQPLTAFEPDGPAASYGKAAQVPNALLRTPDVCAATGYARPTLYAAMADGLFPRPIKLGPKSSAWPVDEVSKINAARIAGQTNDEIRKLVSDLTAARKHRI